MKIKLSKVISNVFVMVLVIMAMCSLVGCGNKETVKYRITFDNNGADVIGTQSMILEENDYYYNIVVPQKNGYEFLGYFEEENGNGLMYFDKNGTFSLNRKKFTENRNFTLYANWKEKYNVKVVTCLQYVDGTIKETDIGTTAIYSDDKYDKNTACGEKYFCYEEDCYLRTTKKSSGYDFVGWYEDLQMENLISTKQTYTYVLNQEKNVVLYAIYKYAEFSVNVYITDPSTKGVLEITRKSSTAKATTGVITTSDKIYIGDVIDICFDLDCSAISSYKVKTAAGNNLTVKKQWYCYDNGIYYPLNDYNDPNYETICSGAHVIDHIVSENINFLIVVEEKTTK